MKPGIHPADDVGVLRDTAGLADRVECDRRTGRTSRIGRIGRVERSYRIYRADCSERRQGAR
ncbi:hypothetical protein [Streptomyces roseicoloratus]|uniref:hypothetical protein n=1 Tax=Streptomyces roseicoloratus TaxID=2508722 RepID=UPI001009A096|nr:hypothetical protein [Streptomyces roseicoloratus]